MKMSQQWVQDLTEFPLIEKGLWLFLKRNAHSFFQHRKKEWVWSIIETLLYTLVLGQGLGAMIGEVQGRSYLEFVLPAVVLGSVFLSAYQESTFILNQKIESSRMVQKYLLAPSSIQQYMFAELIWITLKCSVIGFTGAVMMSLIFKVSLLVIVGLLPNCILMAWLASAIGFSMTSFSNRESNYILFFSFAILPMFLLSGSLIPLSYLPQWTQDISLIFPFTHGLESVRWIYRGLLGPELILHFGVLIFLSLVLTNFGISRITRRVQLRG